MVVRAGRLVYALVLLVTPRSAIHAQLAAMARVDLGTDPGGAAALTLTQSGSGFWLGATTRWDVPRIPGVSLPDVTTGAWRQFGHVFATFSATGRGLRGSEAHVTTRQVPYDYTVRDSLTGASREVRGVRPVADTMHLFTAARSLDLEAALRITESRWAATISGGHRIGSAGARPASWVRGEGMWLVRRPLSLVVGAGLMPDLRLSAAPARLRVTAGVRLTLGVFAPDEVAPVAAPAATDFDLEPFQPGRWRVLVRAPHAHLVELSGDFTGWRPLRLQRLDDDEWMLVIRTTPGTHRVNLRLDGGRWQAPPGTTAVDDDFAGEVGLVVMG